MEFHKTIWVGDRLYAQTTPIDVVRKDTQSLGPVCFVAGRTQYINQRHEVVATTITQFARFVNPGKGVQYNRESKTGVPGNEAPDPLVWERKARGGQTRHWEDVHKGGAAPGR